MKKKMVLILIGIVLAGLTPVLFAKEAEPDPKKAASAPSARPVRPAPPMTGYMEKMMMMQAMREKSVIAASDGGLIVVLGNKIIKYDKDLNIVKEAELKIDREAMRKSMMGETAE